VVVGGAVTLDVGADVVVLDDVGVAEYQDAVAAVDVDRVALRRRGAADAVVAGSSADEDAVAIVATEEVALDGVARGPGGVLQDDAVAPVPLVILLEGYDFQAADGGAAALDRQPVGARTGVGTGYYHLPVPVEAHDQRVGP